MSYRKILPLAPTVSEKQLQRDTSVIPQAPTATSRTKRKRHSDEDWDKYRPLIVELYYNHTLNETIDILKSSAGFECGVRRLRKKVAEWNLPQKNLDQADVKFVLAKQGKRKREEGLETRVIVNGVRLEEPRMQNLQKRHPEFSNNQPSPAAPTPACIDYYTPQNSIKTPAPVVCYGSPSEANTAAQEVDMTEASRTILMIERTKYPPGIKSKRPRHLHPFHQSAQEFAIGSGRFRKHERLVRYLWSILPIVRHVPLIFDEHRNTQQLSTRDPSSAAPCYSVKFSTTDSGLLYNINEAVDLLKTKVFIQTLLSLNKHDGARWQGPWALADELQSRHIQEKANSIFSDPQLAYPENNIFEIVVLFQRSEEMNEEILLRMTICLDPREYVQGCGVCEATITSIDLVSAEGTLTVHFAAFDTNIIEHWRSLEIFKSQNRFKSHDSLVSHFDLVRSLQGWSNVPIYTKCRCGRRDYCNRHSYHEINIGREESRDVWDLDASAHQETIYQQYPMDDIWESTRVLAGFESDSESSDYGRDEDDADVWDPDGEIHGVDKFEMSPGQHEEHSLDSFVFQCSDASAD